MVGANVIGRPQVGFGTTEHVAWTSTVSTAPRSTFFRLTLVPGNPTQYLFDGQPRDMTAETVTVQVPDGNGCASFRRVRQLSMVGRVMV